ncbi:GNAT family N-acetyltransferase [Brevundimonas sp.]|uniref:GNAT family N-acetyltransferase n=1 Tax=Brevundimonas sp. TaxID=1871086 RepID=UPI002730E9EA|nr:N-acetyltransferase [Brevundimonas sp.]MDP1911928.1 N-acetyltransferase [Brevundimonas sp.]
MTCRPISEADFPALQALHRHVGWPERSLAGWRWLHANPARVRAGAPAGWVVDGPDGQPAGHVGNLIQRYWLNDQPLNGATGFSIIVTPPVRGASGEMLGAFASQPGMFAAWVFNANRKSQPLYARHGMDPWPEPTHALKLSWIINPVTLACGRFYRAAHRLAPDIVSRWGERLLNNRLSEKPRLALPPGVSVLSDFRDQSRYAEFWAALRAEGRLLADRSPEVLRWRLADPDLTDPPLVLAFNRGREITGYATAMVAKSNILEPPVLEILDLEALAGEAEAIPALMKALRGAVGQMGAAKLRLQMVSPHMLERLGDHVRGTRREGGWGHCHVRFAPGGPDPTLWSPTPYDGDYAMCLRPVPARASATFRAGGVSHGGGRA